MPYDAFISMINAFGAALARGLGQYASAIMIGRRPGLAAIFRHRPEAFHHVTNTARADCRALADPVRVAGILFIRAAMAPRGLPTAYTGAAYACSTAHERSTESSTPRETG